MQVCFRLPPILSIKISKKSVHLVTSFADGTWDNALKNKKELFIQTLSDGLRGDGSVMHEFYVPFCRGELEP